MAYIANERWVNDVFSVLLLAADGWRKLFLQSLNTISMSFLLLGCLVRLHSHNSLSPHVALKRGFCVYCRPSSLSLTWGPRQATGKTYFNPKSIRFPSDTEGLFKPYLLRASDMALWSTSGPYPITLVLRLTVDAWFWRISYTIEKILMSFLCSRCWLAVFSHGRGPG